MNSLYARRMRWSRALALAVTGVLATSALQAQTVAGSYSVRLPTVLPFTNGNPNMTSVPILSGGNTGGVKATNNLGAVSLQLPQSAFGQNLEHLEPDAYLGQILQPPVSSNGVGVNWALMTNSAFINPTGNAFFEPSMGVMYAAVGGEVEIQWRFLDGSTQATTYVVESAPAGRPYRVYWTDPPYNAPKVTFSDTVFIKFHYNTQVSAPVYVQTTNNGVVNSNVVKGLYIDSANSVNAVGGMQGMIVAQYFKTGMYDEQVSPEAVIVIEVMPPDIQTLDAHLGTRILPQGGWAEVDELTPLVTAGLDPEAPYLYQHSSADGSAIPKLDWLFPVHGSRADPWNIEIYWEVPDLMGTPWFYEVDWYAADWPRYCFPFVRGEPDNPGVPLYFPTNLTPSLEAYQDPASGCAQMQDAQTLVTITNAGRCLVQLTSADDNIWYLPLQLVGRASKGSDLLPLDWSIGREIQPVPTARSILFEGDSTARTTLEAMTLGSNFTLECWVYAANLDIQSNAQLCVFDKNRQGAVAWSNEVTLAIQTGASAAPGTVVATMGSGKANPATLATLTSTNRLSSMEWTHLALTLQGQKLTIYLNGASGGQVLLGTNGVRQTAREPIYIGAPATTNTAPFVGMVDNIRVWNAALTAEDINNSMLGNYLGIPVSTLTNMGLIAYLPVDDDDTLLRLYDLTGRHTATVQNCMMPYVGAVGKTFERNYSAMHGYVYPPYGVDYNTNFYTEPSEADPNAVNAIFAVNTNNGLEIWWYQAFQEPAMPSPVYLPNWVQRFANHWPGATASPQIILASGAGSAAGGIYDQGFYMAMDTNDSAGVAILHKGEYFTGPFSVGVWVYARYLPPAGKKEVICSFGNPLTATSEVDRVALSIRSDAQLELATDTGGAVTTLAGGIFATGRWVYVMAMVDPGNAQLFLDNQLQATSASLLMPENVTRTNCLIAWSETLGVAKFWGGIDELRIWSTTLDDQERQAAMYNVANGMNTLELTTYIPFTPIKGHLVQDLVTGYKGLMLYATFAEPGAPALGSRKYTPQEHAGIYYQNDNTLPGFNPNEEHALLNREGGYDVAYAFRNDLNPVFGESEPFVLVNYIDQLTGLPAMDVLHVARTNEMYPTFVDATLAAQQLAGPHPLDLVPSHWTGADIHETGPAWQSKRTKAWYAVAGGSSATATAKVVMRNYYPQQPGYWFPGLSAGLQPALNTPIPWLPTLSASDYTKSDYPTSGLPQQVSWTISWPDNIPTLAVGDTLTVARDGLPDIWDQLSVDIAYQQSTTNPAMQDRISVFLFDPLCPRGATLPRELAEYGFVVGGPNPTIYMRQGRYYFNNLPPDLSGRFFFDPMLNQSNLVLVGEYNQPVAGQGYLLVNELTDDQRAILIGLAPSNNEYIAEWTQAVGLLANDAVEVLPNQPFTGIALNAPGMGAGYVTLAFNAATNPLLGVGPGSPVNMTTLLVVTNLATGAVIPLEDEYNLLSEQMNMLFNLDFAGEPGNFEFEWRWSEPNANGTTPTDPLTCDVFTNGLGINNLVLNGQSPEDLLNRFFAVRYRAVTGVVASVTGTNWSDFTSFALAEGWVQRILNALTPFEQRMRDLYNNAVETQVSMIIAAGAPYEGPIALNQDNVNNVGLIQMYQTVLNRARAVMDEAELHDANANQQLLLAASRLNDLYMLLGNEAYADAMDPTIGFGSTLTLNNSAPMPLDYGALASSLFCFDNQVASLLEEELALLRGRGNAILAPGMGLTPVYNRLFWNYTKGITAGEVAYSVNYDINGHTNVIIDAETAAVRFPQGHGDAWGYYLDALTVYYNLLKLPWFDWGLPSISPMLMNNVTIDADYFDEKKFAEAGAALARTGAELIDRTYRQGYTESQQSLFPAYEDADTNRAWGVGEWGTRVGVGALCNWMVGNSLLPLPSSWLTNSTSLGMAGAGYAQCAAGNYFAGDFTVEMWLWLRGQNLDRSMALLDFNGADAASRVALYLAPTNRAPVLAVSTGGPATTVTAGDGLATGEWVHVAAVLSGAQASLYVNGGLVGQDTGMRSPGHVRWTSNYVGAAVAQNMAAFAGRLAEMRIWNTARTASELSETMNQRLNGDEAGLVSYWPANEGGGTLLLDRTYNGCSAVAMGMVDWTNSMPDLANNYAYDDPNILKIDRTTVQALPEIATHLAAVQQAVDNADHGLNPLGLAHSAVPFDINPAEIDSGRTHFEQILSRAEVALNNARQAFDAAEDAGRMLRHQQQNANNFQAAVISQEADYTRRLVELYGYPYSDDIGAGKTYPSGYDGPDFYHYMYVDMSALGWSGTDIEPIEARTYKFSGDGKDSTLNPYGYATNLPAGELTKGWTNIIEFHYSALGLPCKPATFAGSRRAEGRLQKAYNEFLKALLVYRHALVEYDNKTEFLVDTVKWYTSQFAPWKLRDYQNEAGYLYLKEAQSTLDLFYKIRKAFIENKEKHAQANAANVQNAAPNSTIFGMDSGGDLTWIVRQALRACIQVREALYAIKTIKMDTVHFASKWFLETVAAGKDLAKLNHDYDLEKINEETKIDELVNLQAELLATVKVAYQGMIQAYEEALAVEQEAERLLGSRERDREEGANRVASMRYNDMAFRIFRNDALGRYSSTFNLAAMYTYLAAKAYDYETALLPAESVTDPGSRFLGDVVRARTLGLVVNGEPQVGGPVGDPGLADILARMKANWAVLEGRFGFNNPERETSRFSLRTELFRILPGPTGDKNWRTALEGCRVDDLFVLPVFRRYCIPFAAQDGLQSKEPGLVIPFSTTVDFGYNFFGKELASGDNSYDPSHFATKIRSVGVWFSNYNNNASSSGAGLATAPRIYIVPAGLDFMRSPTDLTGQTLRSWQVQDQAIPLPYIIGASDLDEPDWIPLYDSLPDSLAAMRRYPSMRAYHDGGAWDSSQLTYNSRLVGRSVWNTEWYLIIPAGTLNSDRTLALEYFIYGVDGDGNGIKDVLLFFETYSYAGN